MRTMYDAVTPSNIPAAAQMVAGYCDGFYAWKPSDWELFPAAVKVRIAVFASTNDGHVLDVEAGDATPMQAAGWLTMRRRAGVDPSIYCSLALWPAVQAALATARVSDPHWWIAAYPGVGQALYPGTVAHQYEDHANLYDLSVVADYWPGVDPPPVRPPAAAALLHPGQEARMIVIPHPTTARRDYLWPDGTWKLWHSWTDDKGGIGTGSGVEDLGGYGYTVAGCWTAAGGFVVVCDGVDGRGYERLSDGTKWVTLWMVLPGVFPHTPSAGSTGPPGLAGHDGLAGPQGLPGPAGATYDDSWRVKVADDIRPDQATG